MPRRTGLLLLSVGLLLVLAVPATAQEDASARSEPSTAAPGEDLTLVFRIESPAVAEVVVQEQVTCTVTFPDDTERNPCEASAGLAEVRTSGSGAREYVFDYQAPAELGTYDVTFRADSTARVLPGTHAASTSFTVNETGPTPQDVEDPAGDQPPTGDSDDGGPSGADGPTSGAGDEGGSIATAGGPDTSRFMVSGSIAAAVLVTTLVANRFPLGG